MQMFKAELVEKLTSDDEEERLNVNTGWQLRTKLVNWRFSPFSHCMLDVHAEVAILSTSFQSNSPVVNDIARNSNKTLRALRKLEKPGINEALFWAEVNKNQAADVLRTCQLKNGVSGHDR